MDDQGHVDRFQPAYNPIAERVLLNLLNGVAD